MIQIIIPMAGSGDRFQKAGFSNPKPFIEVLGLPMIEWVIRNLKPLEESKFFFICSENLGNEHIDHLKRICNHLNINYDITLIKGKTDGAARTVSLCKDKINQNHECIVANCDQVVFDRFFMHNFICKARLDKSDGSIACFLSDSNPKWSFVHYDSFSEKILKVAEKEPISCIATVGIYYFRKAKFAFSSIDSMIEKDKRVNGEFYFAPCYNEMIQNALTVRPYMVNTMLGMGTPEDLAMSIPLLDKQCCNNKGI